MSSETPYDLLRRSASRWVEAPDTAWDALCAAFSERTYATDEHLIFAGDALPNAFFVADGLLRFYYTDREGREWNKTFAAVGSFAGSIASGLLDVPAPFGIQALETSTVLVVPWRALEALYVEHPVLERLGRRIAEQVAVKKELRERAFLELTATERYEALIRDEPDLLNRLPLYHIASYLGVTEVSLSRIRGRLARTT